MLKKFSSAISLVFKTQTPSKETIERGEQELSPIEQVADILIEHQLNLLNAKMDKLTIQDKLVYILLTVVSISSKDQNNKAASEGFEMVNDALQQLRKKGIVKSRFNEERLYEMVIQRLIVHGAEVNVPNEHGWASLHLVAVNYAYGRLAVKILLEHKADIKAIVKGLGTALDLACLKKNYEVLLELILAERKLYNKSKRYLEAVDIVKNHYGIETIIRKCGIDITKPEIEHFHSEPSVRKLSRAPNPFNTISQEIQSPNKLEPATQTTEKLTEIPKRETKGLFLEHHVKNANQQPIEEAKNVKALVRLFEGIKF